MSAVCLVFFTRAANLPDYTQTLIHLVDEITVPDLRDGDACFSQHCFIKLIVPVNKKRSTRRQYQ